MGLGAGSRESILTNCNCGLKVSTQYDGSVLEMGNQAVKGLETNCQSQEGLFIIASQVVTLRKTGSAIIRSGGTMGF